MKEAGFIQAAQPFKHGNGGGERKHVRWKVLAHGDVGGADHCQGDFKVREGSHQLHAAGAERCDSGHRIAGAVVVLGAGDQQAELVGIDKEGDGFKELMLAGQERPDQDVPVFGFIGVDGVNPLPHQLMCILEAFIIHKEADIFFPRPVFHIEQPRPGSTASVVVPGEMERLPIQPGVVKGEQAGAFPGCGGTQRLKRGCVRGIVESNQRRVQFQGFNQSCWIGLHRYLTLFYPYVICTCVDRRPGKHVEVAGPSFPWAYIPLA